MALTFSGLALVNWGFSVGDIATMACAGRAVGNWIMAQAKDRSLLDFLGVDIDTILTRKGLLDTAALHGRWNTKLTLLQNGRPVSITHPAGSSKPMLDSLDRFTWLMILIVSALSSAMEFKPLLTVMTAFLTKLFAESPHGSEFLEHEVLQHVQGWLSSSCVRGMLSEAIAAWDDLARDGTHLPGQIPEGEQGEIARFLEWIAAGSSDIFHTTSSDIVSLASVLQRIGVDCLRLASAHQEQLNPGLYVVFDPSLISQNPFARGYGIRKGIRIPLEHKKDCVSMWPGTVEDRSTLQELFEKGMRSVGEDNARFVFVVQNQQCSYTVLTDGDFTQPMALKGALVSRFLPRQCDHIARDIQDLISGWTISERLICEDRRADQLQMLPRLLIGMLSQQAVAQLQALLMGFYYALFSSILVDSLLQVPEAFGSWGFGDEAFFGAVIQFLEDSRSFGWTSIPRPRVLAFAAYLFAGMDPRLPQEDIGNDVVGIVSKLTILTGACLGKAATTQDAQSLVLLDIDTTCLPCDAQGLVKSARSARQPILSRAESGLGSTLLSIKHTSQMVADDREDFTIHIEPDWENNKQALVLKYRDQGRLVSSLTPIDIELGISLATHNIMTKRPPYLMSNAAAGHLITHHSESRAENIQETVAGASQAPMKTFVACNKPKYQSCITGIYGQGAMCTWTTYGSLHNFTLAASPEEVDQAKEDGWRNVIITDSMEPYEQLRELLQAKGLLDKFYGGSLGLSRWFFPSS